MRSNGQLIILSTISLFTCGNARSDDALDSIMSRDPVIAVSTTEPTFAPGLLEIWLVALDRPEVEMRTLAATTIASAPARGMTGLSAAIEPLRKAFDKPDQHPNVRLAAARALIALDANAAADSLLTFAELRPDVRESIYAALARWDHVPARTVWLGQLDKPSPYQRNHLLAIRALASVKESKAVPKLRELFFAADMTPSLRLEIAKALSVLQTSGLESAAKQCTDDPLAGVTLLQNHRGEDAVRLLQEFATKKETYVAAVAVKRLLEIDTKLVLPVLDSVLANDDVEARRLGVETMLRLPAIERVAKLANRLADPHPTVRNQARVALVKYAESKELLPVVQKNCSSQLDGPDWRGQEQASLLAGQIKYTPVADRLVERLSAKRPEVFIAAAWALRELAVPETLPAVHLHVKLRLGQIAALARPAGMETVTTVEFDRQMSQLVQFMGQSKYGPAEPTFRVLFPRFPGDGKAPKHDPYGPSPRFTPYGGEARSAAIWSLGRLYSDRSDAKLAQAILERLTGDPGLGPDDPRVRRMAAVALTRMKATAALPTLRNLAEGERPTLDIVVHACRWAVAEFEGKPLPSPGVVKVPQVDWFLVPRK